MIESGLWFQASDGKRLAYRRLRPDIPVKAVVLVGHGMNDHSGRYTHLAEALAPLGMAVYMPDLRGHGDTDPGKDRGFLAASNGFQRVIEDLIEFGDFAAKEQGNVPLLYFGHSFGALLGIALAGVYGKYLEGVVLSAPPIKPDPFTDFFGGLIVRMGIQFKGDHAPGKLPRKMSFGKYARMIPKRRSDSDWISRDRTVVESYDSDPKCNFVCTYGFYLDLIEGLRKVYKEGFLESIPTNLPVYLFAGCINDPVVGMKAGFDRLGAMFKSLGLVDFDCRCYEDGRHESINELNRDEVLSDIADWFSRHLA